MYSKIQFCSSYFQSSGENFDLFKSGAQKLFCRTVHPIRRNIVNTEEMRKLLEDPVRRDGAALHPRVVHVVRDPLYFWPSKIKYPR